MEKEEQTSSTEPTTPNPNIPDSTFDADSITQKDRGINTLCNEYNEKLRIDSNSISDCVSVTDEEIIESNHQNESVSSEILCVDGCKTPPPSLNFGSKIDADTCPPGAPMKLTERSSYSNPGLRKKLF